MHASFENALATAHAAVQGQDWPRGALYIVATPIGNLADISLRALHVLASVDCLACEDTRHSQALLRAYGLVRPAGDWLALHQHNEAAASVALCERLAVGQRVAYVSDAGTPGVSDPGARLAWAALQAGHRVVPIPGASSVTALLSAAGCPAPLDAGFVFVGFLPTKAGERQAAVEALAQESRTQVLLEAPHRIAALADSLSALGDRWLGVGRELTKQFEQIVNLHAQDFSAWLAEDANRQRGEFVVVVHATDAGVAPTEDLDRLLDLLLPHTPLKTAVQIAASYTGQARNTVYARALARKGDPT